MTLIKKPPILERACYKCARQDQTILMIGVECVTIGSQPRHWTWFVNCLVFKRCFTPTLNLISSKDLRSHKKQMMLSSKAVFIIIFCLNKMFKLTRNVDKHLNIIIIYSFVHLGNTLFHISTILTALRAQVICQNVKQVVGKHIHIAWIAI